MPRVRRGRQPRRRARLWVVVLALVVLAIATPGLVNLLVTYWWFGELGYGRVYATELAAAWALGWPARSSPSWCSRAWPCSSRASPVRRVVRRSIGAGCRSR